jgi:hypothetical protein
MPMEMTMTVYGGKQCFSFCLGGGRSPTLQMYNKGVCGKKYLGTTALKSGPCLKSYILYVRQKAIRDLFAAK